MSGPLRFVFPLVLLGLLACSDQRLTAPLTPSRSPARDLVMGGGQAQSWDGSCAGSTHFLDATHLQIQGTCQFAHVGRLTSIIEQELTFGQVITYSGTTIYTAPNGDELHTAHSGIATPTADGLAVTLAGTETAVNGTGRFSGAVGSAAMTGMSFLVGPLAGTGSYDLLGRLSFPSRQRQVRELTVIRPDANQEE
jgi:hypothetical protein